MKRREFLNRSLSFATGAVGLVAAGPAGRAMASPAQGHRILDLELFDTARQRPVPVRLYLPQQASAESPVPLVVFSHGLGGSRMGYSYLARHWANAGLASLHPQHVGSDNSVWRGNPLELLQRLQTAAHESEALARVLDLRFALNHVLASDQGQLFNASSIAVAGHSYGANTAKHLTRRSLSDQWRCRNEDGSLDPPVLKVGQVWIAGVHLGAGNQHGRIRAIRVTGNCDA